MDPDSKFLDQLSGGNTLVPINMVGQLPIHPTKKYKTRSERAVDLIVVHCADRDWSLHELNEYDVEGKLTYIRAKDGKVVTDINHISKTGLPAITYHDCITNERIFHTLDYTKSSYHAAGYNSKSVAVGMLYRTTNPRTNKAQYAPTEDMLKLTQCHVGEMCLRLHLTPDKVKGHRELKGTGWDWIRGRKRLLKSCPGPHVDLDLMRTNVAKYMQVKFKCVNIYKGKIDGDFGTKSKLALSQWRE